MRVIRSARPADLPALDALYRQCRRDAPWLSAESRAKADFMRDSAGEVVIAEFVESAAGGHPCGLLAYLPEAAFIHHLYVAVAHRGDGTGTRLLAALRGRLPLPWQLKCVVANADAMRFYARGGWVQLGVTAEDGATREGPHALLELRQAWPDNGRTSA